MAINTLFPLILFTVISTVSPGAATILATASGAQFGFRRSVPLVIGAASGLAMLAAIAAAGLAGLLMAMPSLHGGLKLAGSAYLIWLAAKIARKGAPQPATALDRPTNFIGGTCVMWLNPKGWAITFSAAASFATLTSNPVQLAAILSLAFGISALCGLLMWCFAGYLLARLLRSDWQWRMLNATLGALLVLSVLPMWI
jgi:threonine/homoserine/homoserine lactone efflux protein